MKEFMRKLMLGILITAIVFGSAVSIWLHFYYQQKSPDNLPNLQMMKAALLEKGEVYASEKIVGYDRDVLAMVWGKPVGALFGMDGEIWQVDDTASVVIYFDGDTATNAKLLSHEEETSGLKIEGLDAIVPTLMVDGELYYLAGESYFGARCGVMDGEITSTVERWEIPTKDNQSNFGEYYQMEDGKWKYRGMIYNQMIELVGRTPNAVRDARFVILTNNPNVTFEDVHKSLISSSMSDRFDANETVVVEIGVE